MSTDASFVGAGADVGLELWRIEDMKPVRVSEVNGKFYTGDSYILLSTTKEQSRAKEYALHFWLGKETTQDESGVAAYKTQELHHGVLSGGKVVEYREVEGFESAKFLSYFKDLGGIQYLPGGMDSGFAHVERDVWPTRLLHIKGKRTVRVREVPVTNASLNSDDVFILDLGLTLFIFNGPTANKYEKAKGLEVLNAIKNDNRGGRAELVFVNEDPQNETFWSTLGGFVDSSALPVGESDDQVVVKQPNRLVQISDASGEMQQTEIPLENGLQKELLNSNDVFLVLASEKLYVWVGRNSTPNEKRDATVSAIKFLSFAGLPSSTPIERVSEGMETKLFKSEFSKWDPPMTPKQMASKIAAADTSDDSVDIQALLSRHTANDAPIQADPGSEALTIYDIENFDKVLVPSERHGQFYGGDSYIIVFTYTKRGKKSAIVYFWLGRDSTADERGTAALLTTEIDKTEFRGDAVQVRVTQGKEPAHFRSLFAGRLVIHSGGKASGFRNSASDASGNQGAALFHVRGTTPLNTAAVQVPEKATSLNSGDCFVLVSSSKVYAWSGSGSNQEEIATTANVAQILSADYLGRGGRDLTAVVEGEESEDFWAFLGGKASYPSTSAGFDQPRTPRLFQASNASGKFRLEEIDDYDQTDLNDEDVFLLDTYTQLFVWVGSQSNAEERSKSMVAAKEFISTASDGRDTDLPIVSINAGNEPELFTSYFLPWDPEYTQKYLFVDPYQARLAQAKAAQQVSLEERKINVVLKRTEPPTAPAETHTKQPDWAKPAASTGIDDAPPAPAASTAAITVASSAARGRFSYEELRAGLPEGVDPTCKEAYLDDASFAQLFKTDLASFSALPKWKRDDQKKKFGLF